MVCEYNVRNVAMVQLLLEAPTPTRQRPTRESPPLLTSSLGGHLELTILLLDWGADPNKASTDSGTTPLILAAKDRTEP